ncbi:uncharacterized protein LOC110685515 [Chenopodium quinoa]|uniref:uncharacterized protein LOC110685515 n=1 Tax=Chenopodium quinoa TaxID=63459 RepID=UPI000B770DBD|nr:uncharacterized protein LOC110685515 [Chenopodium quinoa]XP_021717743.1 uncharacterized protein LOC110685515 [Chenopodium quinoa]XP_021717744.1 uncharacterized protein LOC110685515 [Chenopodium quinoa]
MSRLHSNFFSSLKQVEKRLKLEQPNSTLSQTPEINTSTTESLSSPIYLHNNTTQLHRQSSNLKEGEEDSETPLQFLSNSSDFPPTHEAESLLEKPLLINPPETLQEEITDFDEIGLLIELLGLGLSDCDSNSDYELETCDSCHCGSGFFGKIAGVKGPKCKKEMERLEGWISYFRKEKIEPFRLAHLLLGKAAFVHGNGDGEGFDGIEFPSTIDEFLRRDPPAA